MTQDNSEDLSSLTNAEYKSEKLGHPEPLKGYALMGPSSDTKKDRTEDNKRAC